MTNLEKIQNMPIDELAEWLDKNGCVDNSPWLNWFAKKYCDSCESVECPYSEAKEKLGLTPFYDDTIECAYCELEHRCRFFLELDNILDNKQTIKMWLEEEAEP